MKKISLALCGCLLFVGCGYRNYVADRAPANLQEQAELDMEAGSRDGARYAQAQGKLEELLADEPENHPARSLLAACYAAQGGVVLLSILTKVTTSGGSQVDETLLWDSFPDPTAEKLELMRLAVEAMSSIPVDALTVEMTFQKGVFLAAYGVFVLKKLRDDLLTTGTLSPEGAELALDVLRQSVSVAGGSSSPIGGALGAVLSAVENQPGETTAEKVGGWLGGRQH